MGYHMTIQVLLKDACNTTVKALTCIVLCLVTLVYLYEFGMNMHSSSGMPYWDDWGYFFGRAQGIQQSLTWHSLFTKDSDHVAPFFKILTWALWRLVGIDFLAFRFAGWL